MATTRGGAAGLRGAVLAASLLLGLGAAPARAESFPAFVASLWPEAQAHGISRATFEAAFRGVTPDPSVIEKTRTQAEFRKTVGQYLDTAVSDARVALGRERYGSYRRWLGEADPVFGAG